MWKKIFFKRCIYSSDSGIKIFQNWRYRWLTFGTRAVHTLIRRHSPQVVQLEYLPYLLFLPKHFPKPTCLLGLGGGAVVHAYASFAPDTLLEVVECNEEVIEVARRYFYVNHPSIIHDNALHFVTTCDKQYGYVLVDLAETDYFPDDCASEDFFIHCKRLLAPDGFFIMNVPHVGKDLRLLRLIRAVFGASMITIPIKATANCVVIAQDGGGEGFLARMKDILPLQELYWREGMGMVARVRMPSSALREPF